MKNQYVGDINDYAKYALLRALVGLDLHAAVVWMLTDDDLRTDGRKLGYLSQPGRYRKIDPTAFDALREIVTRDERNVAAIAASRLLPRATFFTEVIHDDVRRRAAFFAQLRQVTNGSDLVFFDPDNGMAVPSTGKGARGSSKYLYWDELAAAYEAHKSVLVYQHFPRRPRTPFLDELTMRTREVTGCKRVYTVSTPNVAFALLPRPAEALALKERLRAFAVRAAPLIRAVTFGESSAAATLVTSRSAGDTPLD